MLLADRVAQTTTATGNGAALNITGGAKTGYRTFVAGVGAGVVTYYAIVHQTSGEWEVGIGTVTAGAPDVLNRTTVLSGSSGAGTRVNFSAGTKEVFVSLPASKVIAADENGLTTLPGAAVGTRFTAVAANGVLFSADNTSAAGLNGAYEFKRGGVVRYYIGFNAADEGAILNANGSAANVSWTDSGAFTFRSSVVSGANVIAGSIFKFIIDSRARIGAAADGVVTLFNNAETDFNRLQFGGTTNGFPSLKRSGTTIQARLADDSGYAHLSSRTIDCISPGADIAGAFKNVSNGTHVLQLWNSDTVGDNIFAYFYTETGGSLRGSIDYNRAGGAVRYNTTSDATLKKILGDAPAEKSLAILKSTRLREFVWKGDNTEKRQIGPIAQELHKTFKGAVSVGGDAEREEEYEVVERIRQGRKVVPKVVRKTRIVRFYKPWAVDKTAFTFHLVAGWQDHERRIAELETQLRKRAA